MSYYKQAVQCLNMSYAKPIKKALQTIHSLLTSQCNTYLLGGHLLFALVLKEVQYLPSGWPSSVRSGLEGRVSSLAAQEEGCTP